MCPTEKRSFVLVFNSKIFFCIGQKSAFHTVLEFRGGGGGCPDEETLG